MDPSSQDLLKREAVGIIESNMGSTTAKLYLKFYADKQPDTVVESLSELLLDFVGEKKRTQIMETFARKYGMGSIS